MMVREASTNQERQRFKKEDEQQLRSSGNAQFDPKTF
jgi:hypothetical protein